MKKSIFALIFIIFCSFCFSLEEIDSAKDKIQYFGDTQKTHYAELNVQPESSYS